MRPLLPLSCALLAFTLLSPSARAQATAPVPAPVPVLRLFVVSPTPAPGLHLYDKPGYPKLGYIADKPDLVFTVLESVHQTVEPIHNAKLQPDGHIVVTDTYQQPVIDLGLTPEESAGFYKLTSQNKGKRTLLMLNDTPLTAPMIDEAINTPTIRLTGKMSDPAKLTAQIQTLVKKK